MCQIKSGIFYSLENYIVFQTIANLTGCHEVIWIAIPENHVGQTVIPSDLQNEFFFTTFL